MGLNTRHDVSNDKIYGYNTTRNAFFRFELLDSMEARKIEIAQNLTMNQLKFVLRINGTADIQMFDQIKVFGGVHKVVSISQTFDNPVLFKRREDMNNFTGSMIVGVE